MQQNLSICGEALSASKEEMLAKAKAEAEKK